VHTSKTESAEMEIKRFLYGYCTKICQLVCVKDMTHLFYPTNKIRSLLTKDAIIKMMGHHMILSYPRDTD
jgi:hypothetical protein